MKYVRHTPFLLILLALLAMGCNKRLKNGQTALKPSILVADKTITFPLDSVTGYWPRDLSMYTTPEGREQLVMLSKSESYVQFFDIQTRQRIRKIRIAAVENPHACYSISEDSIFLFSHYHSSLTLIDGQGNIRNQYVDTLVNAYIEKSHADPKFLHEVGAPFTPHNHSIHRHGNHLYLVNLPYYRQHKIGRKDTKYMASRWDIRNGEITYTKQFPLDIRESIWYNQHHFSTAYNPEKKLLVYGSQITNLIETYHIESGKTQTYWIRNGLFDSIPPLTHVPLDSEYEELRQQHAKIFRYGALIYDSYRQVYYYFIMHPLGEDEDDWDSETFFAHRFSILVLDENFKPLGEHTLPDKQYTWFNFFVCRDGFYISNAHPDNPLLKKGEMTFTRLSLNRKAL